MRYPEFLKDNGKIAFIAPSFGCASEPYKERFDKALEYFKGLSYSTVLGPNCYADNGIGISNTPEKCGQEVNDYFVHDKSDIIISCGGGELMCEDLPFIDFDGIREAKAKWYMGYSDNTNLTFLLNTLCDTASIYGHNAPAFGDKPRLISVDDALMVLKGEKLSVHNYSEWYVEDTGTSEEGISTSDSESEVVEKVYIPVPYKQSVFVGNNESEKVDFSGRIIGGCLDCLVNLVGTSFDKVNEFSDKYKEDGIIWFLESCDLNVFDMRRALWHLENAGWFKNVKGFLIGRPLRFDNTAGNFDRIEAVKGILGKYNLPMVMDIDVGHLPPSMPIISGSVANVKARGNELNIEFILK